MEIKNQRCWALICLTFSLFFSLQNFCPNATEQFLTTWYFSTAAYKKKLNQRFAKILEFFPQKLKNGLTVKKQEN